jgi:uncharacterized protein YchJ
MKPVLATLLSLLLLLAVVMCLGTALFIGFGALLARWLPLSLFQASGLAIGATIAFAAIIYVLSTISHSRHAYDTDDDFEDDEDDSDPDVSDPDESFLKPHSSKAARNDYCPCGSGRKFKNCCETSIVQ